MSLIVLRKNRVLPGAGGAVRRPSLADSGKEWHYRNSKGLFCMTIQINIKNQKARALVDEIVQRTGESVTEAVTAALQ